MNWRRTATIARADLRQLVLARDSWLPMGILDGIFFVIVPAFLLIGISWLGDAGTLRQISDTLSLLPRQAQEQIRGNTPQRVPPTPWPSISSHRWPWLCRSPSRPRWGGRARRRA